jgi:hypothetical protein
MKNPEKPEQNALRWGGERNTLPVRRGAASRHTGTCSTGPMSEPARPGPASAATHGIWGGRSKPEQTTLKPSGTQRGRNREEKYRAEQVNHDAAVFEPGKPRRTSGAKGDGCRARPLVPIAHGLGRPGPIAFCGAEPMPLTAFRETPADRSPATRPLSCYVRFSNSRSCPICLRPFLVSQSGPEP